MENIVRVNKQKDFTTMSNHHLKNENLSWKAKGIHSYILSLPDDWIVIIEHLKKVSTDGEKSTRTGINELYKERYWQKYPVYINGKVSQWVTEIYEHPFPENKKIKSIVIKDGTKVINYELDNQKDEENLLSQKGKVDEVIDTSSIDLLSQKVQVGKVEVDNVDVEKEGLLNTNNTKDLSITNHSFIHSEEEKNERKKESIDNDKILNRKAKAILERSNYKLVDELYHPSVEYAVYNFIFNKDLVIKGEKVIHGLLESRLEYLSIEHIDRAINRFEEAKIYSQVKNDNKYFMSCLYESLFATDIELRGDLAGLGQ